MTLTFSSGVENQGGSTFFTPHRHGCSPAFACTRPWSLHLPGPSIFLYFRGARLDMSSKGFGVALSTFAFPALFALAIPRTFQLGDGHGVVEGLITERRR